MSFVINAERNLELKKHVNAIHCSNNLALIQRKLFNALLFNAYPELPHKARFQIKARDLCNLIGYNSNDYGKLKKALVGLITIAIEWNVIDSSTGQEKQWKASSILASAELSGGICLYEYSHVMKELLYQPEIYGRINMELVAKFKSSYGLALYENCIRYQGLPQTPWFAVESFRKLMGVIEEKYTAFKDFKKRVLNIAVDEVNTISPIFISPEIERQNQKVTNIRFKINKNAPSIDSKQRKDIIDNGLASVLSNTFGFSQQLIAEVLTNYDHNYVTEKVGLITQSESFLAGKIRGLAGYLIQALKKDYKPSKSSKVIIEGQRQHKQAKEKVLKAEEESRKARYNDYVNKKLSIYLSSLSKEQYEKLMDEFNADDKNQTTIFQKWYKESGLEHPGVKALFNNFIKGTRKEQLGELLSYVDFVNLMGKLH